MTGVPPLVFESFGYRNCWEPFPKASLVPNFFILNLLGFPKGRTPGHLHDERATGHPKKRRRSFSHTDFQLNDTVPERIKQNTTKIAKIV